MTGPCATYCLSKHSGTRLQIRQSDVAGLSLLPSQVFRIFFWAECMLQCGQLCKGKAP